MDETTVKAAVLRHAIRDGDRLKLGCENAHRLASELGVGVGEVGAVCQAEGVKIVHCQLGCFGDRRA